MTFLEWSKTARRCEIPVDICFEENLDGLMYDDDSYIISSYEDGTWTFTVPVPLEAAQFTDLYEAEKFLWEQWSQHSYI